MCSYRCGISYLIILKSNLPGYPLKTFCTHIKLNELNTLFQAVSRWGWVMFAYKVVGWVKKRPKTCLHNIWTVPKAQVWVPYNFIILRVWQILFLQPFDLQRFTVISKWPHIHKAYLVSSPYLSWKLFHIEKNLPVSHNPHVFWQFFMVLFFLQPFPLLAFFNFLHFFLLFTSLQAAFPPSLGVFVAVLPNSTSCVACFILSLISEFCTNFLI